MKLCIPVESAEGIDSIVCSHFGSAPVFMIYDTDTSEIKSIDNNNQHHGHGGCQPLKALNNETIDAIIVGGIGAGAIMKLNAAGIKVFQANMSTVKQNVDLLKANSLNELSPNNSCQHHHNGCSH